VRFGGAVAFGAVLAAGAGAVILPGARAVAATPKLARVGRVEPPLGMQGARGAGANVGVIFNLIDETRRKTDVDVQYGWDKNGDGKITDGTELNADGTPAGYPNEYSAATEDRVDARNTRRNRSPQLFTTAGDVGAIQEYIWKSQQDLRGARLLTTEHKLTPQGREVPDPDNPGSVLFATGPDGQQVFAGVQVRVRATRTAVVQRRQVKYVGTWAYSTPFGLNNNSKPTMTIDSVDSNGASVPTASDENVLIKWTVFDADSEDLTGDGVLDISKGEDANNNGKPDFEQVGVAFDYHRLAASENPATMTPAQLAALSWLPCTRAKGVGDTDSMDARPGVPLPTSGDLAGLPSAPPGVGRHWTFAWNSVADVGTVYAKFILRAQPFDQKREQGDYVYRTAPLQLDNWRIFNPGTYPAFPLATLASGRVGHTVTRIQPTVNATDLLDRGDDKGLLGFQSILVAGGAQSIGGGSVNDLDLMPINTITAETSTSARVALHLATARAYHTATSLDDGRILFVGGFDASGANPLGTTEVYDPKTQQVTPGPNLTFARAKHAAIKLTTGDVAVFGGIGADGSPMKSCELIQFKPYADAEGVAIATASWTVAALPDMSVAQSQPLAAVLPDQTVLVTGGIGGNGVAVQTAQLLNPLNAGPNPAAPQIKSPIFTNAPNMLQARKYGTATSLIDGNVLFAGGAGRRDFEIYNLQTGAFEPVDPTVMMSVARAQHVAPLLGDGSVLLAGGADDPDSASLSVTLKADMFKVGTRSAAGVWSGSFLQVNGDMPAARRLAAAAVVDNGRTFIVGGADAAATFATVETFTPANGSNLGPKARVSLPTVVNSWLYGTPLYYRLTDPELDHATVEVQYIDRTPTGDRNWRAASRVATTIGGDVSELTADLATTLNDDQSLVIDPVAHNTTGDHSYIWSTSSDIARPAVGETLTNGFNLRVIPYGAVRGRSNESAPISVLYNTKVVPTIWAFENYANQRPDVLLGAGAPTPNQGGDIRIWVHLRDIDGNVPNSNGDPASVQYEYAIDKNGDGLIKDVDGEFFFAMTPKGAPVGHPTSQNPQLGLQTYFNSPQNSNPAFPSPGAANVPQQDATHRPASQGWTYFDWDSVYDIGVPPTTYSNIWIRVTPTDTNNGQQYTGVVQVLHNLKNQPPVLTIIRHPDSVFLLNWKPRFLQTTTGAAITTSAMPINDPIDFTFNGNIEPTSVTSATLPVYRGTSTASQVRGQYTVVNDAVNHTSLVTFWPDPQSLVSGGLVYAQAAASTVLFANDDYSFRIPGYVFISGAVPPQNPPTAGVTIRPLGGSVASGVYSTYLLVQAVPINSAGTDPNYKFHTATTGTYAEDGGAISNTAISPNPAPVGGITRTFGQGASPGVQFTFSRAIDPATLVSPNITTLLTVASTGLGSRNTNPVVPGQWTLTNTATLNGSTVSTTSVAKFTPLFQLPPSKVLLFASNTGLKATNGHSVPNLSSSFTIETYTPITNANVVLESFSNQNQKDATGLPPSAQATTATWGNEGCVPGTLSGASAGLGLSAPSGGTADLILPIPAGQPNAGATALTLTAPVGNYNNIVIGKNCTLTLACPTAAMTLNASGNVSIAGTVGFKGSNGWNGVNGQPYYLTWYGPGYTSSNNNPGVRAGGAGVNGGGSGGSGPCIPSSSTTYRIAGNNGLNGVGTSLTGGQGGQIATETATSGAYKYLYGAGGGAGGGNGAPGLAGGRDVSQNGWTTAAGYGTTSNPGSTGNDAFLGSGMTGGGGGGGGGAANNYIPTSYGYLESGGGGAGAGAVSIVCAGTFNLTPNGCIDGRGGNGGGCALACGSGGAGAGGTLRIVSFGNATMDGVIDLRGGRGGAKAFMYEAGLTYAYANALVDHTVRYGGDGGPGRLLVVAPNYSAADEVRVYGQMMIRQIAVIPPPSLAYAAPPLSNSGTTTGAAIFTGVTGVSGNYTIPAGTTELDWTTLNIGTGTVVDLNFGAATTGVNPVKIFVQGPVTINGTLRINGDSTTSLASGATVPTAAQTVQNFLGRPIYPNAPLSYLAPASAATVLGMGGNMGGGDGGRGCINGTYATGREAGNGLGPAPGVHNMYTSTGYFYSSWYMYLGDTGGSGAANATDGEDGWAPFSQLTEYNYLGAFMDTAITGLADQRGGGVTGQTAITPSPKRIGSQATDVTTLAVTTLANFVGSGGGGGNAGGDSNSVTAGLSGSGGGGAGAIAIVSPSSVTVGTTASIQARGGDGQTPAYEYSAPYYYHAGGGGGSGGTIYLVGDTVSIAPVTAALTDGATFDLRGGLGGGRRSQNQFANQMAYPEYMSLGSYGGNGGYGRLAIDYKTSINGGRQLANRWGLEQTSIDSTSNTFKALAGTAKFFCPGLLPSGTGNSAVGRSKWYDLKSISPTLSTFTAGSVANANLSLRVEGAQSLPNALGSAAGTWGSNYLANTGDPDPANTSGLFTSVVNPLTGSVMSGWRFIRFDASFTRTTSATGAPVAIDNMTATYTSDQ
jgi:hypothetical protein